MNPFKGIETMMGTQTLFALGELTIAVSHTLAKLNNKTDKVLPYLQIPV